MLCKLKEIIQLGSDFVSYRLQAGLNDNYPHLPGNHASLADAKGNILFTGWLLSNPYLDDDIILTGTAPKKKSKLKAGGTVNLLPAQGSFVLRPLSDYRRHFLFFAEGHGILPVMAMVQAVLRVEQRSRIRLVWIDPSGAEFFRNQLDQLEAMVHGRLEVNLPEHRGDLSIWLNSMFGVPGDLPDRTYISGSSDFVTILINRLTRAGIPTNTMHLQTMEHS